MGNSSPSAAPFAKSSFSAIADRNTRLVILGSLPGEASLAAGQYYANPRNQFWRLADGLVGGGLISASYEARIARLLAAGIGLWDVISSGERSGSLDSAITAHHPNDLKQFANSLPALRALAFNGGKAAKIGRKQFAEGTGPALITLPSSSPALAVPFERKQAAWSGLSGYLAP